MSEKQILSESLYYHDMENQLIPILTVDEYVAKMGENKDIATLAFIVKSKAVGNDLVSWFERGYDWILDASVSDGEVETNKFLVFVEMNRRSTLPKRIIELLNDLRTLTNLSVKDWTVTVDEEDYDADEDILRQVIICNPSLYRQKEQDEEEQTNSDGTLNEMKNIAGIDLKVSTSYDKELTNFVNLQR